ncbi:MAG: hypothetical protein ACRDR6_23565 [Pseudonocardiaceae bacterium]
MTDDARSIDIDRQITALTEIVGALATTVSQLSDRVEQLNKANRSRDQGDSSGSHEPAAWVWFSPPAAAEDDPDTTDDPQTTVGNFVTWYNITYVGIEGSRAKPIPDCWRQHPGLAMEVATLAYIWREANIGPSAKPRDAQYWHHQWRPGFTDRLTREWTHADCLDSQHRAAGAAQRPDRFTLAEEKPPAEEDNT